MQLLTGLIKTFVQSFVMKHYYSNLLSYIGMGVFCCFWVSIIFLILPSNYPKEVLATNAPRYTNMFGGSWKFFTPPYTYNMRLYVIVKDTNAPAKPDTLEVLKQIALQKQQNAPLNQHETIVDYLVNNNVSGILNAIWTNKKMPAEDMPETLDAVYMARAIAAVDTNHTYLLHLDNLKNYCKIALTENKIDISGKEIKMQIKGRKIRPFKEIGNPRFLQKETLVFETTIKPLNL